MSDTITIGKMVMALALIMLFASFFMPANTGWNTLAGTLSAGPSLPGGGNPLALNTASITLSPRANDSWGYDYALSTYGHTNEVSPPGNNIFTDGSDSQCAQGSHVSGVTSYPGQYWHCVVTDDANKSGIILPGLAFTNGDGITMNGYTWGVRMDNITGLDLQDQIVNVTLNARCNTQTSTNITFNADLFQNVPVKGADDRSVIYPAALSVAHLTSVGNETCRYGGIPGSTGVGPNFFPITLWANFQNGIMVSTQRLQNFTHTTLLISANKWDQDVVITWLSVTITYLNENSSSLNAACNSFDLGCQVTKIWDAFVGFLLMIVQAIQWLFAWIVFIVQVVVGFIVGLISAFIWLTTGLQNPPVNAPAIVQGIIDVPVFGMLAMTFFIMISHARGSGPI